MGLVGRNWFGAGVNFIPKYLLRRRFVPFPDRLLRFLQYLKWIWAVPTEIVCNKYEIMGH